MEKLLRKSINFKKWGFRFIIFLCIGLLVLMLVEIYYQTQKQISLYIEQQKQILTDYINSVQLYARTQGNTDKLESDLILLIENSYPTTRSNFCIIAKEGELFFVRDKRTTAQYTKMTLEAYLNQNEKEISSISYDNDYDIKNITVKLENQTKYLVALKDFTISDTNYSIGIFTKESYVYSKNRIDVHNMYLLLLFLLICSAFVIFIYWIFDLLKHTQAQLSESLNRESESRKLLDVYNNNNYVDEIPKTQGLCFSGFFDMVLSKLTPEQCENSILIQIEIKNQRTDLFAAIAALLERFAKKNIISCIDGKFSFLVLFLNADISDVEAWKIQIMKQLWEQSENDCEFISFTLRDFPSEFGRNTDEV